MRLNPKDLQRKPLSFFVADNVIHVTPGGKGACGVPVPRRGSLHKRVADAGAVVLCYSCWRITEEALGAKVPDDLSETAPF
jgi:hypothetical protein